MVSVESRLGIISCITPSTNGNFIAIGTSNGGMVVFDLRSDPRNAWFQVVGNGYLNGSSNVNGVEEKRAKPSMFGASKARNDSAPLPVESRGREEGGGGSDYSTIVALAWSADSYQLASLSDMGTLRVWLMKPGQGQLIRDNDSPSRQPVTPFLVAAVGAEMMSSSGKGVIEEDEDLLGIDNQEALLRQKLEEEEEERLRTGKKGQSTTKIAPLMGEGGAGASTTTSSPQIISNRQTCISFHRSFTPLGAQPSILLPRPSGDILSLSLADLGAFTLQAPLPLGLRAKVTARSAPLTHQAIDWIMPPRDRSISVRSQSIYRGHQGRVVFISFLADNQTMVSVDDRGQVGI